MIFVEDSTQDDVMEGIDAYCGKIDGLVEYHESLRPELEDQFEYVDITLQSMAADAIDLLKDDQCNDVIERIQELIDEYEERQECVNHFLTPEACRNEFYEWVENFEVEEAPVGSGCSLKAYRED